MSRWSAEPLRIALAPGEVALLDGRSARARSTDSSSAMNLLPLTEELLSDPAVQGRRTEIILSQHFVRQVVTSPPGKAISRAEEKALVMASLHEIYGDEAAGWRIAVHSQPPQAGLVGAAVSADLLEQLEAMLTRHGCRDISVAPVASGAVRQLSARFDGWWLGVEPGWATLFGCAQGVWQHHAAQPIDENWRDTLPEWLMHEAECAATSIDPTVWLQPFGLGEIQAIPSEDGRWRVLPHDPQVCGAAALAACLRSR